MEDDGSITPQEVEIMLRSVVKQAIGAEPIFDSSLQIADLTQAKLLLHRLAITFETILEQPIIDVAFSPEVVRTCKALAYTAHDVSCPQNLEEKTEWPQSPIFGRH